MVPPAHPAQQTPAERDRCLIVGAFDSSLFPGGAATLENAWLGVVQTLWWFHSPAIEVIQGSTEGAPENVRVAAATLLAHLQAGDYRAPIHLVEGDVLQRRIWRKRTTAVEQYIAGELGIPPSELPLHFDRMRQLPRWKGKQRNNLVGNGFRTLVHEVAQRWGNPALRYVEEQKARDWFPGIELRGRSEIAKMDIAVTRGQRPVAVVSCKWGFRHDRISDVTNECQSYLGAAVQRQWMDLRYYLVTNELSGQRLNKVLEQPCVKALVHLNPDIVRLAGGETKELLEARDRGTYLSLAEWVHEMATW